MCLVPLVNLRTLLVLVGLLSLSALAGCVEDECRLACRHLIDDCGFERPDYSVEDCKEGCFSYVTHYEDEWQAAESRRAVRCVMTASCDDLNEGMACFDEAVYVW